WRFLTDQAAMVRQSTLDQYRQALECHLGVKFDRIRSEAPTTLTSRAYSPEQKETIAAVQKPHNALATRIACEAGLRAHELSTIRPMAERAPSGHRTWREDLFQGKEDWARYTVEGKGGLVREIRISPALARELESARLGEPVTVRDRGIFYEKHYGIGGGGAWSKSVTVASSAALGFSNGAHGFRHGYAQERMESYQAGGYSYYEALACVAQELGHFSPSTTEVYLR
ncbi:MAG: site-specific integrase, partial [Candidatus Nitrospinota bacterium M3_3B_026]